MSEVGIWLLRRLSSEVVPDRYGDISRRRGQELHKVCSRIPWFPSMVRGARILDFGCGAGFQAARMVELGAREVLGLEIRDEVRAKARRVADEYGVSHSVSFAREWSYEHHGKFDVVLSLNAMEHVSEPETVLGTIRSAMTPGGRVVVAFGPLWWHPYGAHMRFFTSVPWVHLWFSEETVMTVRREYRDDDAMKFEEVPGGLNRMTVGRFARLIRQEGFECDYFCVDAINDLNILAMLPGVREFVAKDIFAILRREGDSC